MALPPCLGQDRRRTSGKDCWYDGRKNKGKPQGQRHASPLWTTCPRLPPLPDLPEQGDMGRRPGSRQGLPPPPTCHPVPPGQLGGLLGRRPPLVPGHVPTCLGLWEAWC